MANEKRDVLLIGPLKPAVERGLAGFTVHNLAAAKNRDAFFGSIGHVRAMAVAAPVERINDPFLARLPRLQIIASFGVGYDHIDANAAARRGIVVTHTPEVLTEEVADTALGLLLCTVRELPQAERHLRGGKWRDGDYPLTRATLRNRIVGLVGMGRIGRAIARRLEAFGVPIAYHTRQPRREVAYRHYPQPRRDGARRRCPRGHRAGRHGDPELDRRQGARRARSRWHPHQRRPRFGRR